jgi:acyl dehydratase
MEVLNQKGDLVNNDQLTCLVARRQKNLSQPITSFFATIEDPSEHWECPKKSWGERQQAKLESQYFEDFQVGQAFDTRARTVTETDVVSMVSLTWDHQLLYTDAEYARTTPFRERIAPPLLGIAFAVGLDAPLAMAAGTCLGFTQTDWRFRGPIKIGETVSLEQTITACEAQDEQTGMVTIDMELVNQRGEVSISGTRYMVVKRKTALAQPATSGPIAWH